MRESTDENARVARLGAGNIHYRELGEGAPIVFVHGFGANSRLWEDVSKLIVSDPDLKARCILPDWPLGSHPEGMRPDCDLSPTGVAALISEFLESLDLADVTIVGNDSGGALVQILVTEHPERIGKLVLTNCDAFDKFPPGHFKLMSKALRIPGAGALLANSMRLGAIRRSPIAYGALTERPVAEDVIRSWVDPMIEDHAVRRDGLRFFAGADPAYTRRAATKLASLPIPSLLVWGDADNWFELADAERLKELIPKCELVAIPGGKTFVPIDRPQEVAGPIAKFVAS